MRDKGNRKKKYVVGYNHSSHGFLIPPRVVNPQENGITQKRSWNELTEETNGFKIYLKVFCLVLGIVCIALSVTLYRNLGTVGIALNRETFEVFLTAIIGVVFLAFSIKKKLKTE